MSELTLIVGPWEDSRTDNEFIAAAQLLAVYQDDYATSHRIGTCFGGLPEWKFIYQDLDGLSVGVSIVYSDGLYTLVRKAGMWMTVYDGGDSERGRPATYTVFAPLEITTDVFRNGVAEFFYSVGDPILPASLFEPWRKTYAAIELRTRIESYFHQATLSIASYASVYGYKAPDLVNPEAEAWAYP